MGEWKFLLQRDGDRSWLPLESPDVDVLEGRYRIVAHTGQPNVEVNIRICHLATDEEPPKRRIQKRANSTNQNGLMVVVPFTRLPAGIWDFSCFLTDPMSDLLGDTLHHTVRLKVSARAIAKPATPQALPQAQAVTQATADATEAPAEASPLTGDAPSSAPNLEPNLEPVPTLTTPVVVECGPVEDGPDLEQETVAPHELAALNVEVAQALGVSMDRLVEMTDQLSHQLVEEIFREFNFVAQAVNDTEAASVQAGVEGDRAAVDGIQSPVSIYSEQEREAAPVEVPQKQVAVESRDLQLELAQTVWLARRGEPLQVAGQVVVNSVVQAEHPANQAAEQEADRPWGLEWVAHVAETDELVVQLELRNPQTSVVLHRDRLVLPAEGVRSGSLPWAFNFDYGLPEDLSTHLILGEVALCQSAIGVEDVAVTLDNVLFSVTINPESLVAEFQKINAILAESDEVQELPEQVAQFSARLFKERAKPKLDMAFLDMTTPPGVSAKPEPMVATATLPRRAIATEPQILPPQLYQPAPAETGKRSLELPKFQLSNVQANQQSLEALLESQADQAESSPSPDTVFAMSEAELDAIVMLDSASRSTEVPEMPCVETSYAETSYTEMPCAETPCTDALEANVLGTEPVSVEPGLGGDGQGDRTPDQALNELHALNEHALNELDMAIAEPLGDEPESVDATHRAIAPEEGIALNDPLFDDLTSPIRTAFQALRLQDRFLDRLNSLATDSELTTLLKLMHPEQLTEQATGQGDSTLVVSSAIASLPDAETMAMDEVVVLEDDPVWQEWVRRAGSRTKRIEPERHGSMENPLLLPDDQPVPIPRLDVLTPEVVAGKLLRVRVKLPDLRPKIYVKLWINDRQTRTLLDGPRWLVDFLPDGFGELEATTQLTAPLGSLDVRVEAIAVEMQTQRESQKTSVDLTVEPAEIPDDLFDGIDLDF